MTIGKKRPTYRKCPKCGQQNRVTSPSCHYCGYVFPKTSKKLRLTTAEIGMIVGAVLGLAWGLLLWDEFWLFGVILFFGGGLFGYSLCSGSKADVHSALTGLAVGAILSILEIIVWGGSQNLTRVAPKMFVLPLTSSVAWKGMFMGTRTVRIGGVAGALVGSIAAIVIVLTRSNDVVVGAPLMAIYGAFLGTIAGMGVVYSPWVVVSMGIVLGVAGWLGWGFDPEPIIELPKHLVWGLIMAGVYAGFRRVVLD